MNSNILITGCAGFIGFHIARKFSNAGYNIIGIDNINDYYSVSLKKSRLKELKKFKKFSFIKIDLINQNKLNKIFKKHKFTSVFHFAAQAGVRYSVEYPSKYIESNIRGFFNILEIIRKNNKVKKNKIKLIHVSTDEVYGDIIQKNTRSDENFPYKPSSPYSASKASSDHLIKSYVRTFGISAVISNCCNNYGPYQFPEKLIPKIITNIFNNKPLPIYGKGQNSREWIHVNDHCVALLKLYSKGKVGESYNVGTNLNLKNIVLTKRIIEICKLKKIKIGEKVKIKFVKDRPGHDFRYALNSYKIKRQIKWSPKINIVKGLTDTILWYLNNKNFIKSISKKTYEKRLGLNL